MRMLGRLCVAVLIAFPPFSDNLALGQGGAVQRSKDAAELQRTAVSHYDRGEYEKAIEVYNRAIEINPNSVDAHYHLGMAYSSLGKYKEAVEAYNRAIKIKPDYAAAYFNLGHAYSNLKKHDRAIKAFRHSIQYQPDNVEAYYALGTAYFDAGEEDKAVDTFEAAISRKPDNPYAYYRLGLLYFPTGLHARAAEAFTQVIIRDPRYSEAYFHRAYSYLFLGRGESAAGDAETYLALKGWRAEHSLEMAIVSYFGHLQARQTDAARRSLEEALRQGDPKAWPYPVVEHLVGRISPLLLFRMAKDEAQRVEARTYIGVGLSLQGDYKGAREHLNWVKEHGESQPIPFSLAYSELERMKANSAVSFKK